MRKYLYLFTFLLMSVLVSAGSGNVTSFNDGSSNINITSSKIKYISLPINATVSSSVITIIGFSDFEIEDAPDLNSSGSNLTNPQYLYDNLIADESNETSLYVTFTNNCDNSGSHCKLNESIYTNYTNDDVDTGSLIEYQLKTNSTTVTYADPQNVSIPDSCLASTIQIKTDICSEKCKVGTICAGSCKAGTSTTISCNTGSGWQQIVDDGSCSCNTGNVLPYEVRPLFISYPVNVTIKTNSTVIFNHTGKLNGTNASINLSNNDIETHIQSDSTTDFSFLFEDTGTLNILNLLLSWNKTNSAILSFLSPSEITHSGSGEVSFSIVMDNTGDYNATSCLFQTVSSGTPNYNDDLQYSSFSLENGTNTTVVLTIPNVNQNSEPDEKLQFYCTGTDDDQIVYSDFIDLDITYDPTSETGGSGGTPSSDIDITFKIVVSNFLAEETKQIGIKPNSQRQYCLDIVSINTSESQNIQLSCLLPNNPSRKDVCSWIEFDKSKIDVQPSDEARETFCMQITTPPNILLGEQFVVRIRGTTNIEGQPQEHKITMTVIDYSQFVRDYFLIMGKDTLMNGTYSFIRENIKSDIEELGFTWPNILYPIILLNQILLLFIQVMLSNNPFSITGLQVLYFLTIGVASMFLPFVMLLAFVSLVIFNIMIRVTKG